MSSPRKLTRINGRVFSSSNQALEIAPGLAPLVSRSTRLMRRVDQLFEEVTFTVTTRTVSRQRLQAFRGARTGPSLEGLLAREDERGRTTERLRSLGFEILHEGLFGVVVRGPAVLTRDVLMVELILQARQRQSAIRSTQAFGAFHGAPRVEELFVAPRQSLSISADFSDDADDVIFEPPPLYFQPVSATPAACSYRTIDEAAIRHYLGVPDCHTGAGAVIGMIDTGFFPHPYFAANNYDLARSVTSESPRPEIDEVGHGTAMAANAFAVAPGCKVLGFKHNIDLPSHVPLERAFRAGVDIVTCSWGFENEQVFSVVEATIRKLVREGRIVLFAAGNGVQAWPASMPEVLAVGGVHADENDAFEASNFASGFNSSAYPGRVVPDICGLCGQKPLGVYLMLPCAPGSVLDRSQAVAKEASNPLSQFPETDETEAADGWAGASGTSAATAQLAGAAAILVAAAKAAGKKLDTARLKKILTETAVPVTKGRNAFGSPASATVPNIATGFGLANVGAALKKI